MESGRTGTVWQGYADGHGARQKLYQANACASEYSCANCTQQQAGTRHRSRCPHTMPLWAASTNRSLKRGSLRTGVVVPPSDVRDKLTSAPNTGSTGAQNPSWESLLQWGNRAPEFIPRHGSDGYDRPGSRRSFLDGLSDVRSDGVTPLLANSQTSAHCPSSHSRATESATISFVASNAVVNGFDRWRGAPRQPLPCQSLRFCF